MRGQILITTPINLKTIAHTKDKGRRDLIIGRYQLSKGRSRCVLFGSAAKRHQNLRVKCTCSEKPFSDTCISFANGYCRCQSGSHRNSVHKPAFNEVKKRDKSNDYRNKSRTNNLLHRYCHLHYLIAPIHRPCIYSTIAYSKSKQKTFDPHGLKIKIYNHRQPQKKKEQWQISIGYKRVSRTDARKVQDSNVY